MTLTQLEADLLSHMARRECARSEVVWFVGAHFEARGQDAEQVSGAVLGAWAARGWVEPGGTGADPRLRLTAQAWRDVPWLPLPGSGPLRPVGEGEARPLPRRRG